MKRAAASIQADLSSAREDRESLEHKQNQGSEVDLSTAIDAARQRELEFEAELQEQAEPESSVFESYFSDEDKDTEAPGDSVFDAYFGNEAEPEAAEPEEGLFAEMAKEEGLMDRLTEHAIDAVASKDQEPEM